MYLKKIGVLLILSLFLIACEPDQVITNNDEEIVEVEEVEIKEILYIKEASFVTQINEIYLNKSDFVGKTISYEGYMFSYQPPEPYDMRYFVVRNGPGCCANDSTVGFEIEWSGEMPADNDWCLVTGVLEKYKDDGLTYLRVKIDSIEVLDERGQDTVLH